MSDKTRYFDLVKQYPEHFANVQGGIEILLDRDEIAQAEQTVAAKLVAQGLPPGWADVGVAYQDQYMLILRDAVRFPNGSLGTYVRMASMTDDIPGVVVLPLYQGNVVLERHYRHGPRAWMTEVPRGFGDSGLTPEENARRELQEEIGATVARIESLGTVQPNASSIGGYDCLFFAELSSLGAPDAAEAIAQIILVTVEEFHRMIADGTITDGYTLSVYARARAKNLL